MKKFIIKNSYINIFLLAFIPVLYWKYIPGWFSEWSNPDSFYAYGFFVFGFILYQIKTNFEKIKNIPKEKCYFGIILLLIALVLYIFGYRADIEQAVNLSFPLFVSGIILTLYGRKLFVYLLFPLILFTFTLPIIPLYRITLPLQLLSAKLSSLLINFLGVHSSYEGNIVNIEKFRLEVVAGCSGLRSTSTLFFLGIIYSHFINTKTFKKILFVLFSIPLAIIMNSLRIATVGFYTLYNGYKGMQEFHDNLGIVTFIISLGIMIFIARVIDKNEEPEEKNEA